MNDDRCIPVACWRCIYLKLINIIISVDHVMSSIHDNQVVHVVNVIDKLCILSIICPDLDLYMYWLHVYIFYV